MILPKSSLYCVALYLVFGTLIHAQDRIERVALLGCIRQNEAVPALAKYVELDADLHLWVGDNIYADAKEDPKIIKQCYETLAAKPGFKELRSQGQHMFTWDDHDFGDNNEGRHYKLKQVSKKLFVDFWGLDKEIPVDQLGVYYSKVFGGANNRLQVINLDVRYNRDDPGPDGDVLGEAQWKWLEEQLKVPADLRFIVSGFQVLLPKEAGSETWDQFPKARDRLIRTVRRSQASRVVFITGDQHYGEVCRRRSLLDFDCVELQFAGLNQIEKPAEYNPYRVSTVCKSKHSYAFIDVQWDETKYDPPHLLFRVCNAETGVDEVIYRVNFDEIDWNVTFSQPWEFNDKNQVALSGSTYGLTMRYTVDGSDPSKKSPVYVEPFTIEKTVTVKARLFDDMNMPRSDVFQRTFKKVKPLAALATTETKPGLRYRYIESNFETLPDFDEFEIKKSGVAMDLDVEKIADRSDHYAIQYGGLVDIPETGTYRFYTTSDDGSKLYIHDKLVVDNDGSHSARSRFGYITLERGLHPIRIDYFEDYMGQELEIGFDYFGDQAVEFDQSMLRYAEKGYGSISKEKDRE